MRRWGENLEGWKYWKLGLEWSALNFLKEIEGQKKIELVDSYEI